MKKKLFLLLIIALLFVVGCNNTNKIQEEVKEANTMVGSLKYYVDPTYEKHSELIGIIYNDNTRKIYVKGNANDYNDAIFIDTYVVNTPYSLTSYIENVNNNLSDKDVKITYLKDIILEKGTSSVFARENFILNNNNVETLNYAYFTSKDGVIYTISIHGPNTKSDEIKNVAKDVLSSLGF